MSNYQVNREWSDRFIPTIKAIVGPYLLTESPFVVDTKEATDLIVLNARDVQIACRVRRPGYAKNFPNQFTMRLRLGSGVETEYSKIVNGFGDWMFYGHADVDEVSIDRWMLIDLKAFRAHLIRNRINLRIGDKSNDDGTHFRWFDATSFVGKPELLIADSENDYATEVQQVRR